MREAGCLRWWFPRVLVAPGGLVVPGGLVAPAGGMRGACPPQVRDWRLLLLTRIDHVGIACRDLDQAIAFYESTFGLEVVSRERSEEQGVNEAMLRVADAPAGTSYVQLLQPLGPDTPVGRFLARRGEGVHHVGYGVTDISGGARVDRRHRRAPDRRQAAARLDGRLDRVPAPEGRRWRADRAGTGGRIRMIRPGRAVPGRRPGRPLLSSLRCPRTKAGPVLTVMLVRNLHTVINRIFGKSTRERAANHS